MSEVTGRQVRGRGRLTAGFSGWSDNFPWGNRKERRLEPRLGYLQVAEALNAGQGNLDFHIKAPGASEGVRSERCWGEVSEGPALDGGLQGDWRKTATRGYQSGGCCSHCSKAEGMLPPDLLTDWGEMLPEGRGTNCRAGYTFPF